MNNQLETLKRIAGSYLANYWARNGKVLEFELTEEAPEGLREEIEQALGWGLPTAEERIAELEAENMMNMLALVELHGLILSLGGGSND